MFITKERIKEAYKDLIESKSLLTYEYENARSEAVKMSYLITWYGFYLRDISVEERKEIDDIKEAAWRRFTPEDWGYMMKKTGSIYGRMFWKQKKEKYLNQWLQNQLFDKVLGLLNE